MKTSLICVLLIMGSFAYAGRRGRDRGCKMGPGGLFGSSKEKRLPGCFSNVTINEDEIISSTPCIVKFSKGFRPGSSEESGESSDIGEKFSDLAECLVTVNSLGDPLNKDDVTAFLTGLLEGDDEEGISKLVNIVEECFDGLDDTIVDVGDQMADMANCITYAMLEHCKSIDADPGKLSWIAPMTTIVKTSDCAGVEVKEKLTPLIKQCKENFLECSGGKKTGRRPGGHGGRRGPGRPGGPGRRGGPPCGGRMMKKMEEKHNILKCVGEELNFINSDSGIIDYDAMADALQETFDFTGLDSSINTAIFEAISDCTVTNVTLSETEMEMLPPGVPDFIIQHYKFTTCFMPKYGETCGLNNDLSVVFFPPLNFMTRKVFDDDVFECDDSEENTSK